MKEIFESVSAPIKSNENNELEQKNLEKLEVQARQIASEVGDYHLILNELNQVSFLDQNKNLLDIQIDRVRQKYGEMIDSQDFPTKEKLDKLWEIVTVMELFDIDTTLHCLHTYQVAKNKVEKSMFSKSSDDDFRLIDLIKGEVDLERFYFACIAHDIGKVTIPLEILNNHTSWTEWEHSLEQMIQSNEVSQIMLDKIGISSAEVSEVDIMDVIKKKGIKANRLVPLCKILSPEEIERIEVKGFSAQDSLMDHIEKHELASEQILDSEDFPIVAKIAGRHHNYSQQPKEYPIASDSLYLSNEIATIVHLADMQEALIRKRSYKERYKILKALNIIIRESSKETGHLTPEIVYLWIKDGYTPLRQVDNDQSPAEFDEESKYRQNIENFMESFQQNNRISEWLAKYQQPKSEKV